MLPRANRATSDDLARLGRGHVVRTKHLLFSYEKSGFDTSRIAVSIAKKVAKQATERNRFKRQARAAIKESLPLLPCPVIGIVRITSKEVKWDEMQEEMRHVIATAATALR